MPHTGLKTKTARKPLAILGLLTLMATASACGGSPDSGGDEMSSGSGSSGQPGSMMEQSMMQDSMMQDSMMQDSMMQDSTMMEQTDALSDAEVGEDEIANMLPASGIKKEDSQPLPENPPEGIDVYPSTTNELVRGEIDYERSPATNGDHNPYWQNCGFYDEPVMEEKAVHSLDHGVVWITYQPDLEQPQIDSLRDAYGTEPYVIVSPYENQDSPVVATSWRVQLDLDSADDPRLSQFVDEFRVSELAPLSGNGCIGGSGEPVVAGPEDYYREG